VEVEDLQLDEIIEQIEAAFGQALPFSGRPLLEQDLEVLQRVFGDEGYQLYLQDQVNRQIIRDYLTNAVLLGILSEERLAAFADQVATEAGRAALSLHMLMSSVEDANDLPLNGGVEVLELLQPGPGSPPHMKLVPN
jgi:hypothetical protein